MRIDRTVLRVSGLVASAALLLAGCSHHNVHQTRGLRLGVLTCRTVPGTGISLFIHSVVDVECEIRHSGIEDHYVGQAGIALGLDLRWQRNETTRWTVLAAASFLHEPRGFLAGRFVGPKASLTLGGGAGVEVLFGGGERQIALQPIGVQTSTGAGVAGGIGYLYLDSADSGHRRQGSR